MPNSASRWAHNCVAIDNAGLADAVIAAIDRGFGRADRGHIHNHAAEVGIGLALLDHPAGSQLREKIRPFEIDADHAIETFFGRIENIGPHIGGDAGVVHQHVEPAEACSDSVDNRLAVVRHRHVAATIDYFRAALGERLEHVADLGLHHARR